MEESILKYENDPSYKTFEAFLPELLTVLDKIDVEEVERRMGNSN